MSTKSYGRTNRATKSDAGRTVRFAPSALLSRPPWTITLTCDVIVGSAIYMRRRQRYPSRDGPTMSQHSIVTIAWLLILSGLSSATNGGEILLPAPGEYAHSYEIRDKEDRFDNMRFISMEKVICRLPMLPRNAASSS